MGNKLLGWFRRKSAAPAHTATSAPEQRSRSIANADLTAADIPGDDAGYDWPGIPAFAASFNGYQYWGSFKKCFEVAKLAEAKTLHDLTLTELRTMLFCHYRSINHDNDQLSTDLPRMRTIIREIRKRVDERAID
jgi:hypothetical protein